MKGLLAAVTVLAMALLDSCSTSEPLALDLTNPMGAPPPMPFSITGPAVDEGVVCSEGTFVDNRVEYMDGSEMSDSGWADTFDAAVETNSVAEARSINEYACGDGSGTLTVTQLVRFGFAELDIETLGQGKSPMEPRPSKRTVSTNH
jgi:hypothetical protein